MVDNKEKKMNDALDQFSGEVKSWMTTKETSFNRKQKEEIEFLMKQVFYTLNDFKKAIIE